MKKKISNLTGSIMINNYQAKTKIFLSRSEALKIKNKIGNAGWVNQINSYQQIKADQVMEFEVCVYHPALKEQINIERNNLKWKIKNEE